MLLLLDINLIDDSFNSQNVPCVSFRHLLHRFVGHQTFKGYNPIRGANMDCAGINKGIFFQDQAHRIDQLIVVVFLWRNFFQAINDITGTRYPPGEDTGKALVR